MVELDSRTGPRQYLRVLRHHVLDPLDTAVAAADRERTEVDAEREAYEQFRNRIEQIPTTTPDTRLQPVGVARNTSPVGRTDELRAAYRETVMDVDHYDDVYGEPLATNIVGEFGPELIALFHPGPSVCFSTDHKRALSNAVEQRAREREAFCETVDAEIESIRSLRRELKAVLDTLDTTIVPYWYRKQFEDDLEDVLRTRQSTLGTRSSGAYHDGHNLCAYLYHDEPWTYPVLTAVARLRDSVTIEE